MPGVGAELLQSQDRDSGSVSNLQLRIEPDLMGKLTPTQATSIPMLFRKGTICLPLVTELSRLGLNASPEKRVRTSGWPANRTSSR